MARSKASVEEDAMIADQIAKAHSFSAFLLAGPFDRRKAVIPTGGPEGYAEAVRIGDEMTAQARSEGSRKRAIIYAISKLGSFDVTPEMAKAAGLIAS